MHLRSLFFDPYAQLDLVDLVVPFLGGYRPIASGLGTLAVDLLLVVTVVSLLRNAVGPRVFKAVHWLTYWPVALVHGLGTGTDAGSRGWTPSPSSAAPRSAAAVAWRLLPSYAERGRRPRRPGGGPMTGLLTAPTGTSGCSARPAEPAAPPPRRRPAGRPGRAPPA